jgi:hypothetical protein
MTPGRGLLASVWRYALDNLRQPLRDLHHTAGPVAKRNSRLQMPPDFPNQ